MQAKVHNQDIRTINLGTGNFSGWSIKRHINGQRITIKVIDDMEDFNRH
jgi:hypothetical protein